MDKIISVDLSTSTAPLVQEVRGKDYIEYGDANGEWRNLYPQFLIDLYYSSSITAAIVNATAEMISAEDIVITDEEDRDEEARARANVIEISSSCSWIKYLDSKGAEQTVDLSAIQKAIDKRKK